MNLLNKAVSHEDTERLKESARNSISAGTGDGAALKPTESETSGGVRNKEAEEILAGKKS